MQKGRQDTTDWITKRATEEGCSQDGYLKINQKMKNLE
jgi:hypothetical protein